MKPSSLHLLKVLLVAALLLPTGIIVGKGIRQEQRNRALIVAIQKDDVRTALDLLASGADPNARDVSNGKGRILQKWWDRLRGKSSPLASAPSALLLAVEKEGDKDSDRDSLPLIRALLDKGANVKVRDKNGVTPLLWAVVELHPATTLLLLDHGANVNDKDNGYVTPSDDLDGTGTPIGVWRHPGLTALLHAEDLNDTGMMRLLLEHGADANVRRPSGNTPLIEAADSGEGERTLLLLAHGAKVNAVDNDGCTALMRAAHSGWSKEVMPLLLKQGADVNARDRYGKTALMYSVDGSGDDPAGLQLLLKWGADPHLKNKAGKTALRIALEQEYTRCIQLLTQIEGKR